METTKEEKFEAFLDSLKINFMIWSLVIFILTF